jgi:hypothetical protein
LGRFTFISECGFGGIRNSAPIKAFVFSKESAMASTPKQKRRKKMAISTQFRLIGQFVFTWNLLEADLNDAIISLCKLDNIHGIIVTANLNFQTKMHIFTTMIDLLARGKSKAWIESAENTIARIHTINQEWRIVVVHNVSTSIDTKSVRFLKVSAKRKLNWPTIIKSKAEFVAIYGEMMSLGDKVKDIAKQLSTTSASPSALARVLLAASTQLSYAQGLQAFLHPPPPGPLHSGLGLATLGTEYGMLGVRPPKARSDKE